MRLSDIADRPDNEIIDRPRTRLHVPVENNRQTENLPSEAIYNYDCFVFLSRYHRKAGKR